MYKDVLNNIEGVAIYPIFSLIMFVAFFTLIGIYVFKLSKKQVSKLKNLPLEQTSESEPTKFESPC